MTPAPDGGIKNEDVPMRNAMNEVLRTSYIRDCELGLKRWNRQLERGGIAFRLALPSSRFNRTIGVWSATSCDLAGNVITAEAFARRKDECFAFRQRPRIRQEPDATRGRPGPDGGVDRAARARHQQSARSTTSTCVCSIPIRCTIRRCVPVRCGDPSIGSLRYTRIMRRVADPSLDSSMLPGAWHARLDLGYRRDGERTVLITRAHQGPLVVQKSLYPGRRRGVPERHHPSARRHRRRRHAGHQRRCRPARACAIDDARCGQMLSVRADRLRGSTSACARQVERFSNGFRRRRSSSTHRRSSSSSR